MFWPRLKMQEGVEVCLRLPHCICLRLVQVPSPILAWLIENMHYVHV